MRRQLLTSKASTRMHKLEGECLQVKGWQNERAQVVGANLKSKNLLQVPPCGTAFI